MTQEEEKILELEQRIKVLENQARPKFAGDENFMVFNLGLCNTKRQQIPIVIQA